MGMRSSLGIHWPIYYTVLTSPRIIGVGLCHEASHMTGMPGWEKGSWAYHGDDGVLYLQGDQVTHSSGNYGTGDVIGCGFDMDSDELFFTKNGTRIGE